MIQADHAPHVSMSSWCPPSQAPCSMYQAHFRYYGEDKFMAWFPSVYFLLVSAERLEYWLRSRLTLLHLTVWHDELATFPSSIASLLDVDRHAPLHEGLGSDNAITVISRCLTQVSELLTVSLTRPIAANIRPRTEFAWRVALCAALPLPLRLR